MKPLVHGDIVSLYTLGRRDLVIGAVVARDSGSHERDFPGRAWVMLGSLHREDEGITWCRGVEKKDLEALQSAQALR